MAPRLGCRAIPCPMSHCSLALAQDVFLKEGSSAAGGRVVGREPEANRSPLPFCLGARPQAVPALSKLLEVTNSESVSKAMGKAAGKGRVLCCSSIVLS